jgi:hypothetical protein
VKRLFANALVAAAVATAVAGCSTGDDAVAQGGTFEFVAPGGKHEPSMHASSPKHVCIRPSESHGR